MKCVLENARVLQKLVSKNGKQYYKLFADGRLYTVFSNNSYEVDDVLDVVSIDVFAKDAFLRECK